MWCSHCQQQVATRTQAICIRCGSSTLFPEPLASNAAVQKDLDVAAHAVRTFRGLRADTNIRVDEAERRHSQVSQSAAQASPDARGRQAARRSHRREEDRHQKDRRREKRQRENWLAWALVCFGMMAFTFGTITAGWSLLGDRPDLWHIGLPTFLGGQAVLLLGLVLQLDGLWLSHHRAHRSIDNLDSKFQDLRQCTMTPGAREAVSTKLVELKDQLDQLA